MILELPPETIQAIITKAEQQGITPAQLLAKDYVDDDIWLVLDKHGLNADDTRLVIDEQNAPIIQALLENSPLPNPAMRELLALGENMVKKPILNN